MADHLGASSPALMCKNVSAEKPMANEMECRAASDWTCNERSSGESSAVKIGSPTHPRPRLAMVMPSWVALRNEFRLATMRRATFARRSPLKARASSCVSRIRTKANSAATKNPLINTSPRTSRSFQVIWRTFVIRSQAHIAENNFQHVLQANDADFAPIASQNNHQPLAAALHATERHFEPEIFFKVERRTHRVGNRAIEVQLCLEQKGI